MTIITTMWQWRNSVFLFCPEISFLPGFRGLIDYLPSKGKGGEQAQKETSQDAGNDLFARLPEGMQLIESMIEHCSRFEIYLAELQAVREWGMTFQEWRQLTPTGELGSHEAKLIYITGPSNPR